MGMHPARCQAGSLFQEQLRTEDWGPRFFAYYYKQWENYQMSYHTHDSTEIMYIMSGVCRVDVMMTDGSSEQAVLKKGQFILLDAGVPHRLLVQDGVPCRMLNVEFGFVRLSPGHPSIRQLALEEDELYTFLTCNVPYLVLPDPEEVYHTMKSLVLELDQRGLVEQRQERTEHRQRQGTAQGREASGSAAIRMGVIPTQERTIHREARNLTSLEQGTLVRSLFMQLLVRIARLRGEMERSATDHTELYVKRTIEFMHHNMDRSIQVKDMAAAVNLHPGYLHRIFRNSIRQTPTEYLTMLRMEKAKMLLQQTNIPISEISDYVGIGSRQYFHMLFKKYTGSTPVQYRTSMERTQWNYPDESG
ncbi:AraC-like DNA-binding protein [Paenibacillus barcinonensis]|uniref:AraC-like DNA-binding protein n=2 Tax=Paenibacillus barcinonensis TaxID=198119 RepID=A0A2V4W7S1_PAEBA|nr:AraC family transcriptional regulator [Paenibacillus barcinonensis]PYE47175.1 AraC-like DNA-binding protein [Paenibacillus barcinonensis]